MSMKVEVFSTPGCSKCARARDALKAVVASFGHDKVTWREVNIIDELEYAVELGVVVPPSIAIDGELVFPTLPTATKLKEALIQRLERRGTMSGHTESAVKDGHG
jgi:thioredoxin 1